MYKCTHFSLPLFWRNNCSCCCPGGKHSAPSSLAITAFFFPPQNPSSCWHLLVWQTSSGTGLTDRQSHQRRPARPLGVNRLLACQSVHTRPSGPEVELTLVFLLLSQQLSLPQPPCHRLYCPGATAIVPRQHGGHHPLRHLSVCS